MTGASLGYRTLEKLDLLSTTLHGAAADADDLDLLQAVFHIDDAIEIVLDKLRELEDIA